MYIPVAAFRVALIIVVSACAISACVLAAGGAALGGAIVVTDRRSVGMQVEDTQIEHRINDALDARFARESVRIDVTSYDQKVLLAGQVPSEKDRSDAEAIANTSENVRQVIDELTIGSLAGLSSRTDDTIVAAKVRSALVDARGLDAGAVKIACTDGTIYLFGRVGTGEADIAKRTASRVDGVKRVVAMFELLTDAEVAQYKGEAQSKPTAPPQTSAQ